MVGPEDMAEEDGDPGADAAAGGCGQAVAQGRDRLGGKGSVRGRMTEIGGRTEVASAPGFGTEVRLWVPA